MRDFLPADVRKREYVIGIIKEVYESYGFEPLETPAVENLETLMGKYGALPLAILAAFAGSFAGDQTAFYVGRYNKHFLEKRLKKWECRIEKVHRLLEKHQVLVLISFRFFYGFRNITPFAVGTTNITPLRFFLLNGIGAALWAMTFGVGGYYLGDVLERFLQKAKWWVAGGLFAVFALIWLVKTIRARTSAPRC